jgi:copper resistance protein D
MLEAGLVVSRFLHYTAVLGLFGASIFPLYSYANRAGQPDLYRFLLGAALLALLSGISWLAFTTANMADAPSAATDPGALWSVVNDTTFGHVWLVRLGLVLVVLWLLGVRIFSKVEWDWDVYTPVLAGLLLASLAGVGHTQQNDGVAGIIHLGADVAHLLAAGAWLGGLVGLGYLLATRRLNATSNQGLEEMLLRFSGMGYVAVGVLVASGLINSWYLVGSINGLFGTQYGQLLFGKLCLFAAMLGLAGANRFWLVPSLRAVSKADKQSVTLTRLRRHVLGEQTLGLFIILIVSVLGTMEPAV